MSKNDVAPIFVPANANIRICFAPGYAIAKRFKTRIFIPIFPLKKKKVPRKSKYCTTFHAL